MAGFRKLQGKTKIMYLPKIASTAIAIGDLLYADGSGAVQPADSTSGDHIGICRKAIAATDSDYASNTLIPVEVPVEMNVVWRVETNSTVTSAVIGTFIDLTDANTANEAASAKDALFVVGVPDSGHVDVVIASLAVVKDTATT